MKDITKEIVRTIGVLTERDESGWRKLLRVVRWNGGLARYDLREWSPDDSRCGRGVVLTEGELKKLYRLLKAEVDGSDGE